MSLACGLLDIVFQLPPSPDVVSQASPVPGVGSQWPPRFLQLLSSYLTLVSQMWSLSCLLEVVSQMLPPSCLKGFTICCLVAFHLFPRCGLPVVFHMWFLKCCLLDRCCLIVFHLVPDVVTQLSPRRLLSSCLPPLSQMWSPSCLLDIFQVWCLFRCLPPLSQMCSPSCLLDVFHVWFPRCCLPVASNVFPFVPICLPLVS